MNSEHTETYQQTTNLFPEKMPVYAGFWSRFAAAFIDGLIVGVIGGILQFSFDEIGQGLSFLVNILYYCLLESGAKQATFGKMALGLRVTNLQGDRISFGQALGRYFGKILSVLILFIGYLMMIWDEKKQTLHDKMAGTLVVKMDD